MKRILYIYKEEGAIIECLLQNQVNHLNLIGKRYDKVIIEKGCLFSKDQEIEIACCQYNDIKNWRCFVK